MCSRKVKSPASALGEAIGKLVENAIKEIVEEIVKAKGLKIGKKLLVDKVGVEFEIDLPIIKANSPIALIDVKYLRYKKHARDKSSWVVVAHSRIRATYPGIKRALVILLGHGWTEPAKKLISTSCIDVISLDPSLLDTILKDYGIHFIWDEKDDKTPKESWQAFVKLSSEIKDEIKERIKKESGIEEQIKRWFYEYVLEEDPEEKLKLTYMCAEASKTERLDKFISGKE